MELCLLLLAATAVMVASSGGSPGLLPNLKCGPTTRRGRRLGRLKPVQLPSSCHQSGGSRSAALCDDPGDNYPWEAIDNYLRKSSDFVKKRVENSLKAGRISAPNALRRRRGRSSDDVISSDDVKASAGGIGDVGGEKIREKKHVNAPPGNWEASGDGAEDKATDETSIGRHADLTLLDDSIEDNGSGDVTTTPDGGVTNEDEMDMVVSFFLDQPSDVVTKDALKDMLQFRQTFVTPGTSSDRPATTTTASGGLTKPYNTPTADPGRPKPTPLPTAETSDSQTFGRNAPSEALEHHPTRRLEITSTTTTSDSLTDAAEDPTDLLGSASERRPVAKMPEAQPLVAQPPTIVYFNRPAFPARQRVTVAKTTTLPPPPPRPTVYEPELDDFAELVYATTIQRQPTEAEVPPTPARTTPLPLTTLPTPDPYTESSCQFWEEIRSPFYAMNTRNEWKTLINMPNYETFIHMEHCREEKSQGRCAEGCRCTQKYTVRTMPVYDTDANGCDVIYMDKFLFASHCDCKCLPFGYTIFRKPPLPTTPLPEVIDFVGPLPDGWLPEKPSSGRTEQEEEKEEEEGVKEPLPSSGRPDRLDLAESLPETVESQQPVDQQREEAERVKAGPAPAAATFHRPASAGVRPQRRPLGPVRRPAGPLLPQPGAPPNHRWEALARRQTDAAPAEPTAAAARPNHRNRMRGPPTAPPTYQERR